MSREITLTQRAESVAISIINRARSIYEYAATLEALEKDINLTSTQKQLFRLCIRSIQADCNSMANDEERNRA